MTRFLSKSCPSAASTGRKLWESGGLRLGGKRPELGACPAPTGAPDRTRTCAHGSGIRPHTHPMFKTTNRYPLTTGILEELALSNQRMRAPCIEQQSITRIDR